MVSLCDHFFLRQTFRSWSECEMMCGMNCYLHWLIYREPETSWSKYFGSSCRPSSLFSFSSSLVSLFLTILVNFIEDLICLRITASHKAEYLSILKLQWSVEYYLLIDDTYFKKIFITDIPPFPIISLISQSHFIQNLSYWQNNTESIHFSSFLVSKDGILLWYEDVD